MAISTGEHTTSASQAVCVEFHAQKETSLRHDLDISLNSYLHVSEGAHSLLSHAGEELPSQECLVEALQCLAMAYVCQAPRPRPPAICRPLKGLSRR